MFPVDLQRARDPDRDLGHTCEILNVPLGILRGDGEVCEVIELHPRELLDELLPFLDDLIRGVVILVVGDLLFVIIIRFRIDVVRDLQVEHPEGFGLELEVDLVRDVLLKWA